MSLEIKAIAAGIVALLFVVLLVYVHHTIYESGYAAGIAEAATTAKKNQANNEAIQKKAQIAIAPIQITLQPQVDASIAQQPIVVSHVQAIIHDTPSFGSAVRPAPLDLVRQAELEALRRAAAPSPFSAAGGAPGVRGPAPGSAELAAVRD